MSVGPALTPARREELLRRGWVGNDALWFYEAVRLLGIERANRANQAVVRGAAALEMTRLLRALGLDGVRTFEEYRRVFQVAAELFLTGLFEYEEVLEPGGQRLVVRRCFAHDGVARAGLAAVYECGPGARLQGWLDALGLRLAADPGWGLCQWARHGRCTLALRPLFGAVAPRSAAP